MVMPVQDRPVQKLNTTVPTMHESFLTPWRVSTHT